MPYFDEKRDFMDSYLGRFERFAEIQKWKRQHWAMYLCALLKGRALDVYSRMPPDQASDYDRLKKALLKRYLLSSDGFKKRFGSAKPEAGETPSQFLTRIDNYLERWIELAKVTKSYEGLKTLIVQEQYLSTCPKEMAMHLKEGKLKTITKLGDVAENYVEAHATDIIFGLDPRLPKFRSAQPTRRLATSVERPDITKTSVRREDQTLDRLLLPRHREHHTTRRDPGTHFCRRQRHRISLKDSVRHDHLHEDRRQDASCATDSATLPETV